MGKLSALPMGRKTKCSRRKSGVRKKVKKKCQSLAALHPRPDNVIPPEVKSHEKASKLTVKKNIPKRKQSLRSVKISPSKSSTKQNVCQESVVKTEAKSLQQSITLTCFTENDVVCEEKSSQTTRGLPKIFPSDKQKDNLSWINNFQSSVIGSLLRNAVSQCKDNKWPRAGKELVPEEDSKRLPFEKYDMACCLIDSKEEAVRDASTSAQIKSLVYNVRTTATSAQMEEPLLLEASAQTYSRFASPSCSKPKCPARVAATQTCFKPRCPVRTIATQTSCARLVIEQYPKLPSEPCLVRNVSNQGSALESQRRDLWTRNCPENLVPPQPVCPQPTQPVCPQPTQPVCPQPTQPVCPQPVQQQWFDNWHNGLCTCCSCYGPPKQSNPFCAANAIQAARYCAPPGWRGMNQQPSQVSMNFQDCPPVQFKNNIVPGATMATQTIRTYCSDQRARVRSRDQPRPQNRVQPLPYTPNNCICPDVCDETDCQPDRSCPFSDHLLKKLITCATECDRELAQSRNMYGPSTGRNTSNTYSSFGDMKNVYSQIGTPGIKRKINGNISNSTSSSMSRGTNLNQTPYRNTSAHPNNSYPVGSRGYPFRNSIHDPITIPPKSYIRPSLIPQLGSRNVSLSGPESEVSSIGGAGMIPKKEGPYPLRGSMNGSTQEKIEVLRASMEDSIRQAVRTTVEKFATSLADEDSLSSRTDSDRSSYLRHLFETLGVTDSTRSSILSAFSEIDREMLLEKAFMKYGVNLSARNSILSAFSEIDREVRRDTILEGASETTRKSVLKILEELETEAAIERALEGVSESGRNSILSTLAEVQRESIRQGLLQNDTDSLQNTIVSELSELDLDAVLMKALEECSESTKNVILSTFAESDKNEALLKALQGASVSGRNSILAAFSEIDKEEALAKALEGLSEVTRNDILRSCDETDRDEVLVKALEGLSASSRNVTMSCLSEFDRDEALKRALLGASESVRNSILAIFSEIDKEDALARALEDLTDSTKNPLLDPFAEVDKEMLISHDYSALSRSHKKQPVYYTESSNVRKSKRRKPEGWIDCAGGETSCCASFAHSDDFQPTFVSNTRTITPDFETVEVDRITENCATDTMYEEPIWKCSPDCGRQQPTTTIAVGPSFTDLPEISISKEEEISVKEPEKSTSDIQKIPDCRLINIKKMAKGEVNKSYEACEKMLCNEKGALCRSPNFTKKCTFGDTESHSTNQTVNPSFTVGTQIDMM